MVCTHAPHQKQLQLWQAETPSCTVEHTQVAGCLGRSELYTEFCDLTISGSHTEQAG